MTHKGNHKKSQNQKTKPKAKLSREIKKIENKKEITQPSKDNSIVPLMFQQLSISICSFFIIYIVGAIINKRLSIKNNASSDQDDLRYATSSPTDHNNHLDFSTEAGLYMKVEYISRASERSLIEHVAYITGEDIYCNRSGKTFRYSKKTRADYFKEKENEYFLAENITDTITETSPQSLEKKDFSQEEMHNIIEYDEVLVREELKKIKDEIDFSQRVSKKKELMIPLCVSYEDRELVKKKGGYWCFNEKSWFFSFDQDRRSVEKWLPSIYKLTALSPPILPHLVPQPLWYLNLRSLLSLEQWELLRKQTYKKYSYRCCCCGSKGKEWPVECNEIWNYEISTHNKSKGTVYFKGLEALCPRCHEIVHIGKTGLKGYRDRALARLMYLNDWDIQEAKRRIAKAFYDWQEHSHITDWYFNFEVLETTYGMEIPPNPYFTKIENT